VNKSVNQRPALSNTCLKRGQLDSASGLALRQALTVDRSSADSEQELRGRRRQRRGEGALGDDGRALLELGDRADVVVGRDLVVGGEQLRLRRHARERQARAQPAEL
jgi:hypothetical protein